MSVEASPFITPNARLEELIGTQTAPLTDTAFVGWLEKELAAVNTQILTSDTALRELAAGETSNLHHVMLELEKSKTSFQLVVEVRNKLLEAYQDVMRMQI